jgi:predicted HTH domain antitoxin
MTVVLSVKIDKEKLAEIEEIARQESSDRSTVARRLLDIAVKEWKVNKAIEIFRQDKVSIWKASEMAGLSLREFIELLDERRVEWVGVSSGDLEREVRAITKELS